MLSVRCASQFVRSVVYQMKKHIADRIIYLLLKHYQLLLTRFFKCPYYPFIIVVIQSVLFFTFE